MIRFLHSGDWQLGMTRSVLDDEAHARYVEARFSSIRRLGALAEDARCEFVVVAGDVFESNRVDRKTVARALDALHGVPVPVYLLPGNHDPLDAASLFQSDRFRDAAPPHVHVLDDTEPRPVAPGVELVGAPWRSRRPEANPALAAVEGLGPPGPIRILVAHGGADLLTPDRRDASMLPVAPLESALEDRRIRYVALGDRHSTTCVGKSGRIFYAGTPEPTDFNERDPGRALVVELDHEHIQVTPQRVGTWQFVQWDPFLLEEAEDVTELSRRLADTEAKERSVLRLELRGRIDLRAAAELDGRLEAARDLFAGLDVRDAELERVGTNEDFDQVALGGFAAEAVEALREESALPGEAGRAARDALALCLRLASEGAGA
ncbi:MAG: DNA repair exonuclease [Myxococcota bacterium]